MKENVTIDQFNRLMEKYRLTEPLPPHVRRHLRKSKRRQFIIILKRTSGYSALFVLISNVFFTLKKFGMAITIVKSAIIIVAAALLTAGAVTMAVYFLVLQNVPDPEAVTGVRDSVIGTEDRDRALKDEPPAEPMSVIEDRIGIQAFSGVNLPVDRATGISDRIAGELSALLGESRVINLRVGRGEKRSGMILLGTVEESNGSFSIIARVVNVKDSVILFYDKETAASEGDIDGACGRLAKKIYSAIK